MTVMRVITPKQIPREASVEVTAEPPFRSTFAKRRDTKKIHGSDVFFMSKSPEKGFLIVKIPPPLLNIIHIDYLRFLASALIKKFDRKSAFKIKGF